PWHIAGGLPPCRDAILLAIPTTITSDAPSLCGRSLVAHHSPQLRGAGRPDPTLDPPGCRARSLAWSDAREPRRVAGAGRSYQGLAHSGVHRAPAGQL